MTNRMHILHIITKCDYGGAQTVLREMACEQQRRGNRVSVVTGTLGPVSKNLATLGISVHQEPALVHAIHPMQDRIALRRLVEWLEQLGPDLVHTHSSKGGLLGRRAARQVGIPVVYTAHGWPFQRGAAPAQRVASFAAEWFSARSTGPIVCVSSADLALAKSSRLCSAHRLHLVHNGVGKDDQSDSFSKSHSTPTQSGLDLLMIARFAAPKRQDIVLDALALLPENIRVTFAGDGLNLAAMRTRAASFGDRVNFVGVIEPGPLLQNSDALVLASDYEGSPMSVIEAMRAGLPVVTNRLPGIGDAVRDGTTGLICDLNPESFASTILLLTNPVLRARLGREGRLDWARRFTAGAMVDGYDAVYARALRELRC